MSDEEQGFTFTDRRRGADAEAPSLSPAQQDDAVSMMFDEAEDIRDVDDAEGGQPDIDVYSLLAYCISLLEAQAWQSLGLIADPQTGEVKPDLTQAKVAIDAVGDLAKHMEASPPDAVPESLRRDLRTLVSNLRLNYVGQQGRSG